MTYFCTHIHFAHSLDSDLNSIMALTPAQLLECSAAKHKLSVRPKKTYASGLQRRSVSPQPQICEPKYARLDHPRLQIPSELALIPPNGFGNCFHFCNPHRWLVRLFDGSDNQKEAWVPISILDTKQVDTAIYGDKADDAAYRRE